MSKYHLLVQNDKGENIESRCLLTNDPIELVNWSFQQLTGTWQFRDAGPHEDYLSREGIVKDPLCGVTSGVWVYTPPKEEPEHIMRAIKDRFNAELDEEELKELGKAIEDPPICPDCKRPLEAVRPGKHQCEYCEWIDSFTRLLVMWLPTVNSDAAETLQKQFVELFQEMPR